MGVGDRPLNHRCYSKIEIYLEIQKKDFLSMLISNDRSHIPLVYKYTITEFQVKVIEDSLTEM